MRKDVELTTIELRLLHAISTGASNKQIGLELGKSEFTVRNQLSVAFQKIGVANRMQAAFWFRAYRVDEEERAISTSVPLSGQAAEQRISE